MGRPRLPRRAVAHDDHVAERHVHRAAEPRVGAHDALGERTDRAASIDNASGCTRNVTAPAHGR